MAEMEVGDQVYGTVRRGRYRRYWITEVQDHWSTIKPAYRMMLEDGTELIASGDHRFLTRAGVEARNRDRVGRASAGRT